MKKFLPLFALLITFYSFSQTGSNIASVSVAGKFEDPFVTVGKIMGKTATVDDILANPRLVVYPEQKDPRESIILHSFNMSIIRSTGVKSFETTYGYRFTSEQIEVIKTLKKGDAILIDGVNGKKITESLKYFPSIKLMIE